MSTQNTNTKLAIFPASGGLGGSTLTHLLSDTSDLDLDPSSVVLIARSPDRLASYAEKGVEVRQADYDRPETLKGVFEGVKTLNLISYASIQWEHRFKVSLSSRPSRLHPSFP